MYKYAEFAELIFLAILEWHDFVYSLYKCMLVLYNHDETLIMNKI